MTETARRPPADRPPAEPGGPVLGMLMLDGPYLMVEGGVSHPDTFDVGLVNRIVPGALGSVVAGPHHATVAEAYAQTAEDLAQAGATLLATNCGFAVVYQEAIRRRVHLPLISSTLPLLRYLRTVYGHRVGVRTWDAAQLDDARRRAADWDLAWSVPVDDVQHADVWRRLSHVDPTPRELAEMGRSLLETAGRFAAQQDLSALLLECTGFAPFSERIAATTRLPTFDIVTLIRHQLGQQSLAHRDPTPQRLENDNA